MFSTETFTRRETLKHESLKALIAHRDSLQTTKHIVENDLLIVIRAIDDAARREGQVADTYGELFSAPEVKLDDLTPLGKTTSIKGYLKEGENKKEINAYYCPGCGGWVKGKPVKKHITLGESAQEKGMAVEIFCWIDNYPLGVLKGSVSAKEE